VSSMVRGFVIVDALNAKTAAISHVSVLVSNQQPLQYEVSVSGIWEVSANEVEHATQLVSNRLLVGTEDGIKFVRKILGEHVGESSLSEFVQSALAEQQQLQALWQQYKDEEPKKRKDLVSPKWPEWPTSIEDATPIEMLVAMGKSPYSRGTPKEMRTIIAFSRLIYMMLENWMSVEEERLRRKFLRGIADSPRMWPPDFSLGSIN
jgi:hypothetical protein